jgi:hypothetical protein
MQAITAPVAPFRGFLFLSLEVVLLSKENAYSKRILEANIDILLHRRSGRTKIYSVFPATGDTEFRALLDA